MQQQQFYDQAWFYQQQYKMRSKQRQKEMQEEEEEIDPFESFRKYHQNNSYSQEASYFDQHRDRDFHERFRHHRFYTDQEFAKFYNDTYKYTYHRENITPSDTRGIYGIFRRFSTVAGIIALFYIGNVFLFRMDMEHKMELALKQSNAEKEWHKMYQNTNSNNNKYDITIDDENGAAPTTIQPLTMRGPAGKSALKKTTGNEEYKEHERTTSIK